MIRIGDNLSEDRFDSLTINIIFVRMRISILQYDIKWMDIQYNIDTISRHLATLVDDVDLVVLPEMFLTGFNMDAYSAAINEDHIAIEELVKLARKYNTGIIGSLAINEKTNYYNRVLLITKEGIAGRYDKQYLFTPSGEHKAFSKKYSTSIFDFNGWKILPQVCYDLRFPESVRSVDQADLIIYMANWPSGRIHHWNALLKARAIENQCYVIGCNRIGRDENGWEFPGHSQLILYNGNEFLKNKKDIRNSTKLEYQKLVEYRKKYPFWKDKKK